MGKQRCYCDLLDDGRQCHKCDEQQAREAHAAEVDKAVEAVRVAAIQAVMVFLEPCVSGVKDKGAIAALEAKQPWDKALQRLATLAKQGPG